MLIDWEREINHQEFNSHANNLWSIYNKEAESHDQALLDTWTEDMNNLVIFAGLFSAVLTAFLVDATKNLEPDPTDQTNALLTQAVVLLAQISQQLGPNGSQTIISLPPPLEPFTLKSSDLRVNIFWYMSLGFSITAVLGATLVQEWARNYSQVLRQLSGSLERSRMRQYLFHGLSSSHMSSLVEWIPTFIQISLFLFFIGLADSLFAINKTVAIATTTIIAFCTIFYIASSVFPVLYPQTPFRTPLSNVFWIVGQIIHPRKFRNRSTEGKIIPVSPDIAKGRLHLAMGVSDDREMRDAEAIRWVLTKTTEDSEFEPFLTTIDGSLDTPWGINIWESIFRRENTEIASNPVRLLKNGIESLLRSSFRTALSDQQTRFTRTCICINAVASFTLRFNAELKLDIDDLLMAAVLQYFGEEKRRRDKPVVQESETSSGSAVNIHQLSDNRVIDPSLEFKWRCLVLTRMRRLLQSAQRPGYPIFYIRHSERFFPSDEYRIYKDGVLTSQAREADRELLKAWNEAQQLFLKLRDIPDSEQLTEDRLRVSVPDWSAHIEAMERSLDALSSQMDPNIDSIAVDVHWAFSWVPTSFGNFCEWPSMMDLAMWKGINWGRYPPRSFKLFIPQMIPPRLLICHLLVCADPRRRPNSDGLPSQVDLEGLKTLLNNPELQRTFDTQRANDEIGPYINQFWRIEDIIKHKGVGFMIEMFFATFRSLEQRSMTEESEQLIRGTLRAIIDKTESNSEYFRSTIRRSGFLWALREDIRRMYRASDETPTPPRHLVYLLWELFGRPSGVEEEEQENGEKREWRILGRGGKGKKKEGPKSRRKENDNE